MKLAQSFAALDLALLLAEWAADAWAATALRQLVSGGALQVTAWAVVRAAQVAPDAAWREPLRKVRPLFHGLGLARDELDATGSPCAQRVTPRPAPSSAPDRRTRGAACERG